jgi:hypothetical protein
MQLSSRFFWLSTSSSSATWSTIRGIILAFKSMSFQVITDITAAKEKTVLCQTGRLEHYNNLCHGKWDTRGARIDRIVVVAK